MDQWNYIYKSFTWRRIIFLLLFILFFFIKKEWIVSFINKFLLVPSNFSTFTLDVFLTIFSIVVCVYVVIKIVRYNYLISYLQFSFLSITLFFILYFFKNKEYYNWNYLKVEFTGVEYVWLFIIPLLLFLIVFILKYLDRLIHFKKPQNDSLEELILIGDDPILEIFEDRLDYEPISNKLFEIITSQESDKSISIGLVGPWGNGKSSVINLIKKKLNPLQDSQKKFDELINGSKLEDYLVIHFLPYLNHKEDDLISEFFRELSSVLLPHNGKLSNLILDYAQRLIDIYKNNIHISLLEKHINSFAKTSAKEMYDEINERLKEVNKKIIVFVDDLDRLNEKEVLQVLKLIRNTADFRNVVFVVAMDKNYVVELLLKKREVLDSKFIDKFFQLEVYLPEIRTEKLRIIFDELLKKKTQNFDRQFKDELDLALKNKNNLFEDYIKNIRDVKRVINQVVYEYPFIKDGINLKDFLNFTYFKLKFPLGMKILKERRHEILETPIGQGFYSLVKTQPQAEQDGDNIFLGFNKIGFNYDSLKQYQLYTQILHQEKGKWDSEFGFLSEKEKLLFLKTLAFLFGDYNNIDSPNSIRKENNFMMLMEQRIFEDHLSEYDFQYILSLSGFDMKTAIEELHKENKINQLLDRLDYASMTDLTIAKSVMESLAYIYNDRGKYNQYDSTLLTKLGAKTQEYILKIKEDQHKVESFREMVMSTIFDNDNLSLATRIFLVTELWDEKSTNKLWKFEPTIIEAMASKLFNLYLKQFDEDLWEVNNFEFYHIVRNLRLIENIKEEVNHRTGEFWKNNNIKLLCAQIINFESWSYKAFAISETAEEIFNSRDNFIEFIKGHENAEDSEIQEYIHFLELCKRVNHSIYVLFTFKVFILMKQRIELYKNSSQHGRMNEYEGITHLYFEYNSVELQTELQKYNNEFKLETFGRIRWYNQADRYTLFVVLKKNVGQEGIIEAANTIRSIANQHLEWNISPIIEELVLSGEKFIETAEGNYVKLFSKQP